MYTTGEVRGQSQCKTVIIDQKPVAFAMACEYSAEAVFFISAHLTASESAIHFNQPVSEKVNLEQSKDTKLTDLLPKKITGSRVTEETG
jgi:hypothetical protein